MRKNLLNETGILRLKDVDYGLNNVDLGIYTGEKFIPLENEFKACLGKDVIFSVTDLHTGKEYFKYEGMLYKSKEDLKDYHIKDNNIINALWNLTETKVNVKLIEITEDEMEGGF